MLVKLWCYFWAYVYEALGLLDRLWEWAADQVDNNDYLAGALGVVVLYIMVYLVGGAGVLLGGGK